MAFWNKKQRSVAQFAAPEPDSLLDETSQSGEISKQQLLSALDGAKTALMMINRDLRLLTLTKPHWNY
ncbi:hypothetical protein ACFSJQ_19655 [Vibrio olivae]